MPPLLLEMMLLLVPLLQGLLQTRAFRSAESRRYNRDSRYSFSTLINMHDINDGTMAKSEIGLELLREVQ